jgi:hypothetical protein
LFTLRALADEADGGVVAKGSLRDGQEDSSHLGLSCLHHFYTFEDKIIINF